MFGSSPIITSMPSDIAPHREHSYGSGRFRASRITARRSWISEQLRTDPAHARGSDSTGRSEGVGLPGLLFVPDGSVAEVPLCRVTLPVRRPVDHGNRHRSVPPCPARPPGQQESPVTNGDAGSGGLQDTGDAKGNGPRDRTPGTRSPVTTPSAARSASRPDRTNKGMRRLSSSSSWCPPRQGRPRWPGTCFGLLPCALRVRDHGNPDGETEEQGQEIRVVQHWKTSGLTVITPSGRPLGPSVIDRSHVLGP